MNLTNRLNKLRAALVEKEIDAILISQPENRHYLSGFDGSAGYLLITPQTAIIATDFRYIEQAKIQAPDYDIFRITNEVADWFPRLIGELELKKLGFEAGHMTFALYKQLTDTIHGIKSQLRFTPLEGLVESHRAVKEPEEIELITRAVEITDSAFEYIADMLHAGMSEREAAWEIEKFLREKGSQPLPFDIIVASGPNAALPHAKPSERIIQESEPVIVDIGARLKGYTSDMTHTFCPGDPDDTFKKVYDIVLGAQLAALAIIKEGISGSEADTIARTVIEEAGYKEAFGHGLGHGVGLATHEMPRLGPNSTDKLASGMVFTVEPGIYLPRWGGVRIEDVAVIENGKAKVISKARKT
jgi:Xaa-Pro aminopeptidase